MPSSLTWLDHDTAARERSHRLLEMFKESDTRDELGIGAIRDSIADQLFPGTSVIQTRLRYMLMVPWLFMQMEDRLESSAKFPKVARQAELDLSRLLSTTDEKGVFGKSAGDQLKRLASSVYWAGMGSWGIRVYHGSQQEYFRQVESIYTARARRQRKDDGDWLDPHRGMTWHPALGKLMPEDFPDYAQLQLSRDESLFVREQWRKTHPESLLAWLAFDANSLDSNVIADAPWLHPRQEQFPVPMKTLVEHGRQFSALITKQLRPRLRFPSKQDGTFPGMNALALTYPCQALADIIDPLHVFNETGGQASLSDVRLQAHELITEALQPLAMLPSGDLALPDRRWYWVALVLLDRHYHPEMQEWCRQCWAMARRGDDLDAPGGFWRHVQHWLDVWTGTDLALGRVPDDLVDVLTDMALAGPAICAFRSLRRVVSQPDAICDALRSASVHIAEGIRSQFNAPEAIAVLQQTEDEDAYWQRVLQYGAEGNLQAVLDEYIHLQYEANLSCAASESEATLKVADSIFTAASIRSSQLRPDFLNISDGKLEIDPEPISLRCRYAVRYGQAEDEDGAIARKEVVRAAFNSPFRPFVLASTSVGQEGLDFHSWCHSIVHWNLPSNPVDLEQREGRVHRYKGHAVRKNAALASRRDGLRCELGDPWETIFAMALDSRPKEASDLIPYWIYEIPDGAKVERRVFNLPMSKDESRLRKLKSSLALYRMVFGQPRQDDLMEHLLRHFDEQSALKLVKRWRIDLAPSQ